MLEIGEPLPIETDARLHRYGQFTQYLAQRGHDVIWWTSSFSHAAKRQVVERDELRQCFGVQVQFIRGPGYGRNISLARIRHNRHFASRFNELAPAKPVPDLIIAPVPIIEAAAAAVSFGRRRNVPVLADIRDMWPDELRDRAPRGLRWLGRMLLFRSFQNMRYVCREATGIMAVSRRFMEYGLSFAERDEGPNDLLFPLGYSGQPISPEALNRSLQWCRELGLREDRFIVAFFGTIGEYFALETVIKAARTLRKEFPLQIVLAGDGGKRAYFKELAKDVPEVLFPGWLDAPKIAAVMKMAKVGLAPYRRDANMTLPNKPFEYMAGALPIVSSIQAELPAILREANCGITYDADSVQQLADALRKLYSDEELRRMMGLRARQLFESRFTSESVFDSAAAHMARVMAMSRVARQ